MTIDQFLVAFQDMLQRDEEITLDTELHDLEEWDSMSVMACMAWFDMHFGIKLSYKVIEEQKTVRDIVALSNGNIA